VLNTSFRASGKLADAEYYGSIYWDGLDQNVVILGDVAGHRAVGREDGHLFDHAVLTSAVERDEVLPW